MGRRERGGQEWGEDKRGRRKDETGLSGFVFTSVLLMKPVGVEPTLPRYCMSPDTFAPMYALSCNGRKGYPERFQIARDIPHGHGV